VWASYSTAIFSAEIMRALGFKCLLRVLSMRITGGTYLAHPPITAPGRAKLTAIKNNLEMEPVPVFLCEQTL
jgi:hypothetical protein